MNIKQFKCLGRLEQGKYLYSLLSHAAELIESIELDDGETQSHADAIAELCGWHFCDSCRGLVERRSVWGFCDACASETEKWEREKDWLEQYEAKEIMEKNI